MKATLVVGAFLAAGLIASPVFAKVGDPINGVPIGLESDPGSVVISQTKTNKAGVAVFQNVKPGKYRFTIGTINWGDGSTARGPISKKQTVVAGIRIDNEQPGGAIMKRTAVIEINVPGQTKVVQIISNAVRGSRIKGAISGTVVDPQSLSPVAFTVAGNKVQTVTVRFYYTLSL
jgi:hypothetical protein